MVATALAGFGTGMGLIAAIGAQNVFVLSAGMARRGNGRDSSGLDRAPGQPQGRRQGRRDLILVPLVCFLCDVVLMSAGIGGVGSLIAANEILLTLAAAGGAVFLAAYGLRSLAGAFSSDALRAAEAVPSGTARLLLAVLAVTLLNPHVYLDCLVVMGGIGSRYPLPDRFHFLAGVLAASFVWFFGLSLFGRILSPLLSRPAAWRVLRLLIFIVLALQSASLLRFVLGRL